MTKYLNYPETPLQIAVDDLQNGEIIGFPTETVYGIGADIFNPIACQKIFDAKRRNPAKALSAHISSIEMLKMLSDEIDERFFILAEIFLPGPLAIIIKKSALIDPLVTGNLNTIGIRYPSNQAALDLISLFGKPIAATSANLSGEASSVDAKQVFKEFNGILASVIDAGQSQYSFESTVISIAEQKPIIFRQGVIPKQAIEEALSEKLIAPSK